MKPLLKWVGGKTSAAPAIAPFLPADTRDRVWREPFLGAGGMFLAACEAGVVRPERAELSDAEVPLVRFHREVAAEPERVMAECDWLALAERTWGRGVEDHYLDVRRLWNEFAAREPVVAEAAEAAGWLLYLNKTGFNGLYRTNRRGELNTPWGKRSGVTLYERENVLAVSAALRAVLSLATGDFEEVLHECAGPGDVVYLDPPYVPAGATANFTGYGAWRDADHDRLARLFRELDRRGCLLVLSNSDTPRTRELYEGYDLTEIAVPGSVSASAGSRAVRRELVVRNLASWPASARRST